MSIKKGKDFDYQEHMRKNPPNPDKLTGYKERQERHRTIMKKKLSIRLDTDVVERFKELSGEGSGYQSLINKALREWLDAQSVHELLKEKLPELMKEAVKVMEQKERPKTKVA